MIKIYGMDTCPDCTYVKAQVKDKSGYELKLRDSSPVFDEARKNGYAGIPCFVLDDGTVTLSPEDAGLEPRPADEGLSCSIDGTGC